MVVLICGLLLFFTSHSVSIVNEPWRDRMARRLGEPLWQALYGLVALAGLLLMGWGYGLARQEPILLYLPPVGLRHATALLMLPVFPLLLAAYLPGAIRRATGHPMLLATLLWALAHLLANGTLADVLLFGTFLLWAALDRRSLARRGARPVPGAPPSRYNDAVALLGGLALYAAFLLGLHRWLFGVAPIG